FSEPASPALRHRSPPAASPFIWSLLQAFRESNAGTLFSNPNQELDIYQNKLGISLCYCDRPP
ncbi:hypothetical protein HN873_003214, partial [Arachis hypogaea]